MVQTVSHKMYLIHKLTTDHSISTQDTQICEDMEDSGLGSVQGQV